MRRPSRRAASAASRSRPRIRHDAGPVYQLRVELDGFGGAVWRRLEVSSRASLFELHEVIERAMGRDGSAALQFTVDGVSYLDSAEGPPPGLAAESVALATLQLHPGARFQHLAEQHGEPWRHVITLETIGPRLVGQRLPVCLSGSGASPPEGCTGPAEYAAMLRQLRDPHAAIRHGWIPEQFDPEYVDVVGINAALRKVEKRRPGERRQP